MNGNKLVLAAANGSGITFEVFISLAAQSQQLITNTGIISNLFASVSFVSNQI